MFFLFFFTSFLSSEYLMSILLRANLLMFLGANNINSSSTLASNVSVEQTTDSLYNGTYYYESSDNFDRYLQELGVGYFLRKLAALAFPIITVSRLLNILCSTLSSKNSRYCPEEAESNCSWSIKTDAGLRTHEISFKTGDIVDDVTMDGRNIRSVFSVADSNTLTEFQIGESVNSTLIRYFYNNRMEVHMIANDVRASSIFKRNVK